MLLRIGHKPRGGFPRANGRLFRKTVQILIDAARTCGGGAAAQDDGTPLELRKR